jgi:hypothetical protein
MLMKPPSSSQPIGKFLPPVFNDMEHPSGHFTAAMVYPCVREEMGSADRKRN